MMRWILFMRALFVVSFSSLFNSVAPFFRRSVPLVRKGAQETWRSKAEQLQESTSAAHCCERFWQGKKRNILSGINFAESTGNYVRDSYIVRFNAILPFFSLRTRFPLFPTLIACMGRNDSRK